MIAHVWLPQSALVAVLLGVFALAAPTNPATATFPGQNGKIAFEDYDVGDEPDIAVANADGSGFVNLTNDPAEDITPAWSPAGTKIAFASDREQQGHRSIYTMNADGSGVSRITTGTGDFWPAWSPDGSEIVYRSSGDINTVPADGGQPTVLHSVGGGGVSSEPDFSPDGSRIAFSSNEDGDSEIWVMDSDGGNPTQLTHNSVADNDPSWSPDGTKIAFTSNPGGNHDVWIMNADGSGLTNTSDNPADDEGPDWSPDGSLIAFYSDRNATEGMYIMGADGLGQHLTLAGDLFSFEWQRPLPPRLQGDVNCDEVVNTDDAGAVIAAYAGLDPSQEPDCPAIGGPAITVVSTRFGDVDCSGDITPRDGLMILLHKAELPTTPEHEPCTEIGSPLPEFDLPPP